MTPLQRTAANMLEGNIRSMIEKAGMRGRMTQAEELVIPIHRVRTGGPPAADEGPSAADSPAARAAASRRERR